MPYVTADQRAELDATGYALNPGELNYLLTRTIQKYIGRYDDRAPDYQRFNDAVGALESCKQELYRRAVAPYEDLKSAENGDVYPAAVEQR